MAFVRQLMEAHSAERIAAAYVRLQLAARPAPEELLDAPAAFIERGPRESRTDTPQNRSDFTNGVWFRVSVGRKHRAEPRWLLPMICKAGHVTKRAVGAIKISDTESRFEIAGDKAESFWAAVRENGTGEKGVAIQRLDGEALAATGSSDKAAPALSNSTKKGKSKPRSKSRLESPTSAPPSKKIKKKRPKL